jgi:hypothetical protein
MPLRQSKRNNGLKRGTTDHKDMFVIYVICYEIHHMYMQLLHISV